jgi:Fe-S cluster assembly protein SufD
MSAVTEPKAVAVELKEAAAPYVEAFEALAAANAAGAPAWLEARRSAAMARFADAGFPTSRQEEWRFTDLKALARTPFALAEPASGGISSVDRFVLGSERQWVVAFVNGVHVPALSRLDGLPSSVVVGSLREAVERHPALVEPHLASYATDDYNPLAALNTGFIGDGAFLYVPRNVVLERQVHFLFLTLPAGGATAPVTHPRNLYVLESGAQASLVESYAAAGTPGSYWTNAVTEAVVGDNANLDAYRFQREHPDAFHTGTTYSTQGRDSNYSLIVFTFGAGLSRHDIRAVLAGEGADATLDGLSMLRGRQHTDYHTTLEHAQPNCTSWEYFNGVFDDRARGVFNGRIIVRPGAQKTDSKQTNNNLLLSASARADSQPQLEIYADDVKCTHGATLGPIDDEHMFYLQSRGLTKEAARGMLTYGFGSEILNAVNSEQVRQDLDRIIHDWLKQVTPMGA